LFANAREARESASTWPIREWFDEFRKDLLRARAPMGRMSFRKIYYAREGKQSAVGADDFRYDLPRAREAA
jgi:hypothetical protein